MLNADGVAAVENLRAELARAKEQARKSDAAAVGVKTGGSRVGGPDLCV